MHSSYRALVLALTLMTTLGLLLAPAQAAPAIGTDNAEAVKENKRVAIERFGVEFYTQLFGEGRSGKSTARMTAELQGISDTTRQAITQQACSETVAALQKAGIQAQPVLLPEETQIQFVNSGGSRTFGVSHRLGHSGAVYLKEPLVAADNIFEMCDTQPDADKDKQTAVNFLSGLIGGSSERSGTSAVTASSEDAYRSTYQALIRDALEALVGSPAAAR